MVIVDKSLTKLLEEIEGSECVLDERISISTHPDFFSNVATIGDNGSVISPNGYYRGRLMEIISPEYKPTGFTIVKPPKYDSCLQELLINASERGNKSKEELPIRIKIFRGQKGHVLRIEDSGDGFDFRTKVAEMRSGSAEYFQRNGGGLRTCDEKPYQISYEGKGNVVYLQVMLGQ